MLRHLLAAAAIPAFASACAPQTTPPPARVAGISPSVDSGAAPVGVAPVRTCDPAAAAEDAERVKEADARRDLALEQAKESKGAQGVATPREAPVWDPQNRRVVVEEIPDPIRQSMAAREAYLRDVPPECDSEGRAPNYAFYVGDRYFAYGHFEEARRLLAPFYEQHCATSPHGFATWRDLLLMSNMDRDNERSRRLALAERDHPCAGERPPLQSEPWPEVLPNAAFSDAASLFEAAARAPAGPERERLLRKGAKMYEDALTAAPAHHDAPFAAMRAASMYFQVGEVGRAIHIYNLFIDAYGNPSTLDLLEHGGIDPQSPTKAVLAPQPDVYKARIEHLAAAYDALTGIYLRYFAYSKAAEGFAVIAGSARFDARRRANAARTAMGLYSALGDRAQVTRMHEVAASPALRLTHREHAEIDCLLASFDFRQWSQAAPAATDEATRLKAIAALTRFHEAQRGRPASAPYVLEAACRIAKMKQAAGDPTFQAWFKTTRDDWGYFDSHPGEATEAGRKPSPAAASDAPYADCRDEADLAVRQSQLAAYPFGPPGIVGGLAPMGLPVPSAQP